MTDDQDARDTLRRGMRGDDGLVHAPHALTAEHPHAGWWMTACQFSFRKHEDGQRWTEDPTTCLECECSPKNRRIT